MKKVEIKKIGELNPGALQALLKESRAEGFAFLEKLANEYSSGVNRFQKRGETLLGAFEGQKLIAICGLNQDPYHLNQNDIGRVRHLYVLPACRRQGIGRALVQKIIAKAKRYFTLLTLRTPDPDAYLFYAALGFQTKPKVENATHHLRLE